MCPLSGLAVQGTGAAFALLNIAEGVSRVHASRRVFDILRSHEDTTSVIHHRSFPEGMLGNLMVCTPVKGAAPEVCCGTNWGSQAMAVAVLGSAGTAPPAGQACSHRLSASCLWAECPPKSMKLPAPVSLHHCYKLWHKTATCSSVTLQLTTHMQLQDYQMHERSALEGTRTCAALQPHTGCVP